MCGALTKPVNRLLLSCIHLRARDPPQIMATRAVPGPCSRPWPPASCLGGQLEFQEFGSCGLGLGVWCSGWRAAVLEILDLVAEWIHFTLFGII